MADGNEQCRSGTGKSEKITGRNAMPLLRRGRIFWAAVPKWEKGKGWKSLFNGDQFKEG